MEIEDPVKNESATVVNRGFAAPKIEPNDSSLASKSQKGGWSVKTESATTTESPINLDPGKLPLITNEAGDKVLRMYWLDAFEDQYKHPGTVWLFGKVYIESAKVGS